MQPDKILESAAELFRIKNAEYGDNWKRVGPALAALFPEGLTLRSPADFDRAHIFFLIMVKMSRYASNWAKGGHKDSIDDLTVYGSMLTHIDAESRINKSIYDCDGMKVRQDTVADYSKRVAPESIFGYGRG